jgi:Fic family protein
MSFDPRIPFNDLPLLPPMVELETRAVLKEAILANRALAKLNGAIHSIPNQAILIQAIGLQEAKLSSEIENIVTTNDELYLAFADKHPKIDSQTKEVLYYKDALWHGYNAITKEKRLLTTPLFIELSQIIINTTEGLRKLSGTVLKNPQGEVLYTPPTGESVIKDKLANLSTFIHTTDDMDPLIKMAIIHYQFEAIHPFSDGNGRTGRIINILYLIQQKLLDMPVLYLSSYIIENKSDYYTGLRKVTKDNDWENWLLFMLRAIAITAEQTHNCLVKILLLMQNVTKSMQEKLPKIYSKDLVDILFCHPYCKIRFLEDAGIAGRQTCSHYLKELEKIGILRSVKIGREHYYINDALYKILTSRN